MTDDAPTLLDTLASGTAVAESRPWPRFHFDIHGWRELVCKLAETDWALLGLWAETNIVHMALRDEQAGEIAIASLARSDGQFPSVGRVRPGAIRLERAAHDLFGMVPEGTDDDRPWLDHGRWDTGCRSDADQPYSFLAAEGDGIHQIPVGPVHAGIIEPGHFRFHANGETVVRLEERLGYVHKGIESLMAGATVERAAMLAGRMSGDSTVAYALAFARAVEAARAEREA